MQGQYNLRSPAVKRLMREAQELREPTEQYFAQPLEDNLFEWHFTIRGPTETEFEDGIYHGRIVLPPEYPMKPPSIILLTANGRFETHKKICLSISGHHPESWQPSWSIRTALLAIIGFMPTHGNGAIGSLDYTPEERKSLAKKSLEWKCPECGSVRLCLREVTEASKALSKEAKELGAQINMQGEKEKGSTSDSPKEDETDGPQTTNPAAPEAAAVQPGLYPNMPSFPGFSPQMLQMMRAHFANAPGGMPPMGMNPFMSNMMNAGAGPQAGPGGTPNRPQGMPNFPFWPPNFGTLSGGSAIPRFPMWPPGVTVPTNTNTTDSVQVASSSDLISSSSPQSVTGTTSTSPTVTSMPSASPSVSTSAGARPKTSSSAEAISPGATSTSSSPPSPESASVSGATPESTSNQGPTSSDTAPASDPVSAAITPPTSTPPGTSPSAPSGVRQRNVGPAQAQGIIPGVGQHAELPRPQQSEGLSFSLCLLTLLGIALAILMIRRLIMMDIIRFYDTIE